MCQLLQAYCLVSVGVRIICSNTTTKNVRTTLLQTHGVGDVLANVTAIFDRKQTESIVRVKSPYSEKGPLSLTDIKKALGETVQFSEKDLNWLNQKPFQLDGYVSSCSHGSGRAARDRQYFYINSRPCDMKNICKVVNDIYHRYNAQQSPFIYLNILTARNGVDVNVTPDKRKLLLHNEKLFLIGLKYALLKTYGRIPSTYKVENLSVANIFQPLDKKGEKENEIKKQKESEDEDEESVGEGIIPLRKTQNFVSDLKEYSGGIVKGVGQKRKNVEPIDVHTQQTKKIQRFLTQEMPMPSKKTQPVTDDESSRDSFDVKNCHSPSNDLSPPHAKSKLFQVTKSTATSPQLKFLEIKKNLLGTIEYEKSEEAEGKNDDESSSDSFDDLSPPHAKSKLFQATSPHFKFLEIKKNLQGKTEIKTEEKELSDDESSSDSFNDLSPPHAESKLFQKIKSAATSPHFKFLEIKKNLLGTIGQEKCEQVEEEAEAKKAGKKEVPIKYEESDVEEMTWAHEAVEEEDKSILCSDAEAEAKQEKKFEPSFELDDARDDVDITTKCVSVLRITEDEIEQQLKEEEEARREAKKKGKIKRLRFKTRINPSKNSDAEAELEKEVRKTDFASMEIVGQFNLGFIIARLDADIFIIDQHASDEKYNFEMLQRNTVMQHQRLVVPQMLGLTAVNELVLMQHLPVFERNGFKFEIDEDAPPTRRVRLLSKPFSKNWDFGKEDIEELIFMLHDAPEGTVCRPSRIRAMFASRACRSSIMIGTALSRRQMCTLVRHMGEMDQPWNCPHGRPTMRHLINTDMMSDDEEDDDDEEEEDDNE